MPGSKTDTPSVSLSFANNFWGKDDAGVGPMLDRMHGAKTTSDELKSFYTARASIEDEYARKLLSLARKPLGSAETGTLRMSLDVVRGEVESMGKAHQNIALQMKTELDEPLTAFAGAMKERRKIVQGGVEKLHKSKTQQTTAVNKARDRYEQDCLKIKGYLAQGHMVMGQEERKNKAKLEKTQIQLSTASNEYDTSIRILEETTAKWNKEWKAGCDKFQDLEEERIDFMKSSLWSFANIASTVCVSDDASCEKIRLSLEDCDVEKDIATFIRDSGTGQEIPDAPKFINFCREDAGDSVSEASAEENYSVAQFQRNMNPVYRTSSPQPAVQDSGHRSQPNPIDYQAPSPAPDAAGFEAAAAPRQMPQNVQSRPTSRHEMAHRFVDPNQCPPVPYNEDPEDGMTQFCRINQASEISSAATSGRPSSRGSGSEYSNPTSFSSVEPSMVSQSSLKHPDDSDRLQKEPHKKRSGFFQNRSPFRRKSKGERDNPRNESATPQASKRNTWGPQSNSFNQIEPPPSYSQTSKDVVEPDNQMSASPEAMDPRTNFQLNVGNNVFDVASPDTQNRKTQTRKGNEDDVDPIAQALAELKGINKQSSVRQSADRYAGMATPGPGMSSSDAKSRLVNRGVPPASSHLGAPQPAFTSKQMQQTTQRYVEQTQNMFNTPPREDRRNTSNSHSQRTTPYSKSAGRPSATPSRATSPSPYRSASPRPAAHGGDDLHGPPPRATSPAPHGYHNERHNSAPRADNNNRPRPYSSNPSLPLNYKAGSGSPRGYDSHNAQQQLSRAVSPKPQFNGLGSAQADMSLQLASVPNPVLTANYGSHHTPPRGKAVGMHPGNQSYSRPSSQYDNSHLNESQGSGRPQRMRSRSVADGQKFTQDGRRILHYARAMYIYQAAIPEELTFAKNDVLAILRHQDDGWWEAEVVGRPGIVGLAPSNYLQRC